MSDRLFLKRSGADVTFAATFVVTRNLAYALSALILLAVLVGIHLLMRSVAPKLSQSPGEETSQQEVVRERRRGIKALVIGTDGRASTSKTQAVLWTIAVVYALLFLLLWGRSFGCDKPPASKRDVCAAAVQGRDTFADFTDSGLQPAYYILLGFPFAAALAAKAMTQAKVEDKTLDKPKLPEGYEGGFTEGLTEIVSNDHGEGDLMDFQYFLFNLVTLAFFLFEFLPNPAGGFPELPGTLLSLSGLSTAAYTAKKALEATPQTEAEGSEEASEVTGEGAPTKPSKAGGKTR